MQSLVARGYNPAQAAALGGHVLQESGGNPAAINQGEDAHGLLQWRGDRWNKLQELAKVRGTSPNDPDVQLDFIRQEMAGPEAKSSAGFQSATDLDTASAALKPYVRFGDDSAGTRLNNARGLFAQAGMIPQAPSALPSTTAVPAAGGTPQPGAPAAAPADDGLGAQLAAIPKMLQAQQANQQYAPMPVMPDNLRARMAAIAAARQIGQPS